jgi:hypothetical protein
MNKLIKTIPSEKLSIEFLRSLNGLLGLTDRELSILSTFLAIHLESVKLKKAKKSIDCTENRKIVMDRENITKDNLCRYIQTFKSNKLIVVDQDGMMTINKALIPIVIGNKTIQITMLLKLKDND